MPRVTDLATRVLEIAGSPAMAVVDKAPSDGRTHRWNVVFQPCGHAAVLGHVLLVEAFSRADAATALRCPGCAESPDWSKGYPDAESNAEREARMGAAPLVSVAVEPWTGADLAPCGERLETFGRAEGLETAQAAYALVVGAATQSPRPASTQIPGMSTLGTPCDRKLAARMLEGSTDRGAAWRPFVGTAGHQALSDYLCVYDPNSDRWARDVPVTAGGSKGILDVFDVETETVIDFKFTGVTKLREVARGKVLPVYQTQLDLYALGLTIAGQSVKDVAVLALPLAGEVEEATWYLRPADLGNAGRALQRAWRIKAEVLDGRPIGSFAKSEDSCTYCPLFRRGDCEGVGTAVAPPRVPITWGG